jgi:hypothetical protein
VLYLHHLPRQLLLHLHAVTAAPAAALEPADDSPAGYLALVQGSCSAWLPDLSAAAVPGIAVPPGWLALPPAAVHLRWRRYLLPLLLVLLHPACVM